MGLDASEISAGEPSRSVFQAASFRKTGSPLQETDKQAGERFDTLMTGYKRAWNITEELKAEDPMRWVGLMNNARAEAETNVITEIVCC